MHSHISPWPVWLPVSSSSFRFIRPSRATGCCVLTMTLYPPSLFPLCSSTALAVSGGQLPISSLEGGSKVLLGGAGGTGGGLPSSLFLNHSALLPMGPGASVGLVSAAVAKATKHTSFPATSSMSPTSCSPSSCSSSASSCSSSEVAHSPSALGGAKTEWRSPWANHKGGGEGRGGSTKPRLSTKAIFLSPSISCFHSLSQSFKAKNTQNEREEREGEKEVEEEKGKGGDLNQKIIYLSRWRGGIVGLFCQQRMNTRVVSTLKKNEWKNRERTRGWRHVTILANQKWQKTLLCVRMVARTKRWEKDFYWKDAGERRKRILNQKNKKEGRTHNDKKWQPCQNPKYQKPKPKIRREKLYPKDL